MAILDNTPKFFLTIFASPRHAESGFDGCTRGTLGEIDIFINDHISLTMHLEKLSWWLDIGLLGP